MTLRLSSLLLLVTLCAAANAFAEVNYSFNCNESSVQGHVKYALIGSYDFYFKDCQGSLSYNPQLKQIDSVRVKIRIKSIDSNCPLCNRVAVSKKLLNAANYPYITYQSTAFEPDNIVHGIVNVHGISKGLISSFTRQPHTPTYLNIKGSWALRRKAFHIIWSKVLDHGGILVGDIVTIDWQVHAHKE